MKKIGFCLHLFSLICLFVTVGLSWSHLAWSQETIGPGMEEFSDRTGNDFRFFQLPNRDPSQCASACTDDDNCYAWTYVRPTTTTPVPLCYLKHPAPQRAENKCCISGLKREKFFDDLPGIESGDRLGSDIARIPLNKTDPMVCLTACLNNPQCAAWTYVRPGVQGPDPVCYLKNPVPPLLANECCLSAFRGTEFRPQRITGFQIVDGSTASIGPRGVVDIIATCPSGKQAIAAGYSILPPNQAPEARFGYEIKGAIPEGNNVKVRVRNSNNFEQASAHAIAVCISSSVRTMIVTSQQNTSSLTRLSANCPTRQNLIGGGFLISIDHHVDSSGPQSNQNPPTLRTAWRLDTKQPTNTYPSSVQAICADNFLGIDGWEFIASQQETVLVGRSSATTSITCPNNKLVLSAGVVGTGPDIALLTSSLEPTTDRSTWRSLLVNRDTLGGIVRARMVAICANAF